MLQRGARHGLARRLNTWRAAATFFHHCRAVGSAALRHWIACGHGVGLARWRARAAAARELARLRRHHLYISARRGWACWVAAAAARRAFRDRAVDARWQLRSKREEGAEPQPQPQPQPQP